MQPPAPTETNWTLVAEGLHFPEGPAWDGHDTLYFSNCHGGYISRLGPDGYSVFFAADAQNDIHQRTNGITIGADGMLYVCEWGEGKGSILRIDKAGKAEVYCGAFEGKPFNRPNDCIFDPAGNLYFTDPNSYHPDKPDGVVYRIDKATQQVSVARAGFCFSNGLAFDTEGKFLYLAESAKHRVLKLPVLADGTLGEPEVFVEMPGGDPDGMNFDAEGRLYIAHFGGGAVWIVNPDGTVHSRLKTPGKKPSNVEFAGPDLKTLYVTEDETESVYTTRVEVAGLPLFFHPSREK